jgi:GNAT superfamily N-acetyltransferase
MKFSIRPYRKGEERYVAEAHRRVYSDEYRWNSVFTDYAMSIPLQFAEKEPDSREEMWVAENEDTAELLGSVMLCSTEDPQVGQLRLFLVEKRARGCGIGSALADTVLERAEKEGYRKLILSTADVLKEAVRLYRRLGFATVREVENNTWSLDGETFREITMEKNLL